MIGARMRASGRSPLVIAVMIWSVVHLPSPVSLSGVRLGGTNTPFGIAKPTSEPPRTFPASGLPKKLPGVWQSLQPAIVTRYLPRATCWSAATAGWMEVMNASTAAGTANRSMFFSAFFDRGQPRARAQRAASQCFEGGSFRIRGGLREQLHQVALPLMPLLDRRDVGRVLGGAVQLRHAADELHRFLVGARQNHRLDARGEGFDRFTRMRRFRGLGQPVPEVD